MEFIEFYLPMDESVKRLKNLISFIADKKNILLQVEDLEYNVLEKKDEFFTDYEFNSFWWPSKEENYLFWEKYQKLSDAEQIQHLKSIPWDFETVFSEIGQGEYTIQGITEQENFTYRLYINPTAYPFGSIEALEGLLNIYGADILQNSIYCL